MVTEINGSPTTVDPAAMEEHIVRVCRDYVRYIQEGRIAAIVDLYAPEATVQDPVDTPTRRGHEEIREFYQGALDSCNGSFKTRMDGEVQVRGLKAAFAFIVSADKVDVPFETRSIDVMHFDAQGRIVSMLAYWGDRNARVL